jgi:hypothetical protein
MPTNKIVWIWKMYDELTPEQKAYVCTQRHVDVDDTTGPFEDRPLWVFIEALFLIDELGLVQKIVDVSDFKRWKQRLEERADLTPQDRDTLIDLRSKKAEVVIKLLLQGDPPQISGWVIFPELPAPAQRSALQQIRNEVADRFNIKIPPINVCLSAASLMLYQFNEETSQLAERKVPTPEELATLLKARGMMDVQVKALLFELDKIANKLGWDLSKS